MIQEIVEYICVIGETEELEEELNNKKIIKEFL